MGQRSGAEGVAGTESLLEALVNLSLLLHDSGGYRLQFPSQTKWSRGDSLTRATTGSSAIKRANFTSPLTVIASSGGIFS